MAIANTDLPTRLVRRSTRLPRILIALLVVAVALWSFLFTTEMLQLSMDYAGYILFWWRVQWEAKITMGGVILIVATIGCRLLIRTRLLTPIPAMIVRVSHTAAATMWVGTLLIVVFARRLL